MREQKPKPVRENRIVKEGYYRRPPEEPLVPGLRKKEHMTNAIGFTARIVVEDDDA